MIVFWDWRTTTAPVPLPHLLSNIALSFIYRLSPLPPPPSLTSFFLHCQRKSGVWLPFHWGLRLGFWRPWVVEWRNIWRFFCKAHFLWTLLGKLNVEWGKCWGSLEFTSYMYHNIICKTLAQTWSFDLGAEFLIWRLGPTSKVMVIFRQAKKERTWEGLIVDQFLVKHPEIPIDTPLIQKHNYWEIGIYILNSELHK